MAYCVGEVIHKHYGIEAIAVRVGEETPDQPILNYERRARAVTLDQMHSEICDRDLLLVNPSFSPLGLGPRLSATKIMYVQDFKTFQILDGFCDHYVSVSRFVADFLKNVYDIDTPIIPAFVDTTSAQPAPAWAHRSGDTVFFANKGGSQLDLAVQGIVLERLGSRFPNLRFEPLFGSSKDPHDTLMRRLSGARYLLTLTLGEGFGLLPLEAMSLGVPVMGFDGFGGRAYMRPGSNSAVVSYPNVDDLIDSASRVLTDPGFAQELASAGQADALKYSKAAFEAAWASFLSNKI
jgi:glycosyltransferase involved in cell wall biosynthesis